MRIQCPFLIVDAKNVLTNAQIVVREGRVCELHESPSLQPDLLLDNSVILPGLINAHTHLEFSHLRQPFPAGRCFPDWIAEVVQYRRRQAEEFSEHQLGELRQQAIQSGLKECWQNGTALLVDIVTPPWSPDNATMDVPNSEHSNGRCVKPRVIGLTEILGLEPHRLKQSFEWACRLNSPGLGEVSSTLVAEIGFSPHAPYSLSVPEIFEFLSRFPTERLMAIHLAESREEREWLESGSGPFRNFFQSMGLPVDQPRMQIDEAIDLVSEHPRSLVIHGNYLNPSELDRLSRSSASIVYCPRTHRHFGHTPYPLGEMIQRDIPVLLGTDSRATNPDLSLWSECKAALQNHPQWNVKDILDAVTNRAAHVLGVDEELGSLSVGKSAWMNVIPAPAQANAQSLLELLFLPCNTTYPRPLV